MSGRVTATATSAGFCLTRKLPGGSISAVAVLKGNMEKEPVILIALYEDNMLKEVKTGSVVRSENGETELRATLSNLPESVSGCTVKAFLLRI